MEDKERDKNKRSRRLEWETGVRVLKYFENMFADTSNEGERRFIGFCKKVLFFAVLFIELLLLSVHVEFWVKEGNWVGFLIVTGIVLALTAAQVVSLFVLKSGRYRKSLYVLQSLSVCALLILTKGPYAFLLYMLMLTQLYLDIPNSRVSVWILVGALLLYTGCYVGQVFLSLGDNFNLFDILRDTLGSLGFLALHFLVLQIAMAFYRQYLRLNRTLKELDESKRELEKAYAVVAEVSALEERQRIAKDIHDTAGHSLTTVIMQTESAKRIIESNPEEAKTKIIAANLQAKTTLERLRESVHLLSGMTEGATLKTALESIVHESTDGTGIRIRSEIADMVLSFSKSRFLCNALREGISNGLRHGNATAFWVELKEEDGKAHFLLSDNGKGMNVEEWKLGFGLNSMRERANSFGGDVQFYSEPDEGFEIHITIPMDTEV